MPAGIIDKLFADKTVAYTGKLYSPEHKHSFNAENIKISIAVNAKSNKPFLALGDMYYADWFKERKQKMYERMGMKINGNKKQVGHSR